MESRANAVENPLHTMAIVFPLGLLVTAAVDEAFHLATGNPRWAELSYWMIVAGLAGGFIAVPQGVRDWRTIPSGTRAKAIGTFHVVSNVSVLGLFAASYYLRSHDPA